MAATRSKEGEFITYEDDSKLHYTNKAVEETIRMANIAAFIFRTATKDVDYKGMRYLPHPQPTDGAEFSFSKM